MRPGLGRLDRTRFAWLGGYVEAAWAANFAAKIEREIIKLRATDVHLLPHGWGDFTVGYRIATRLGLRVHVSIHDDFSYTALRHPMFRAMTSVLGEVWRNSATRFVISEEMGQEYSRRHGNRPYQIHTDGVKIRGDREYRPSSQERKIYFMGMFHNSYIPNFRAFLAALGDVGLQSNLEQTPRFTLRTHGFNPCNYPSKELTEWLPPASQDVVESEIQSQQLLYLPLPFERDSEGLCKFSLSTKMVTYLASGVPIIYHGPADSAAGKYLLRNSAAIQMNTNDSDQIAKALGEAWSNTSLLSTISTNALQCAKRDFDGKMLRDRFWNSIFSSPFA